MSIIFFNSKGVLVGFDSILYQSLHLRYVCLHQGEISWPAVLTPAVQSVHHAVDDEGSSIVALLTVKSLKNTEFVLRVKKTLNISFK